ERPPDLHACVELAAPVPIESTGRGRRVDEAALSKGAGRECVGRQCTELAAQEARLGRDESELVAPIAHLGRQQVGDGAAKNSLRLTAADQLATWKREGELDEAVVEEWDTRLERVRHRVPILVAQQLGQSASREHELLLPAETIGERKAVVAVRQRNGSELR